MVDRKGRSKPAPVANPVVVVADVVKAWRESSRYAVEIAKDSVDVHHVYRFVELSRNKAKSLARWVHIVPDAVSPADVARYCKPHVCTPACMIVTPLIHPGYEDVLALVTSFVAPFYSTRKTQLAVIRQRTVDALTDIAAETARSVVPRFFYSRLQFIEVFLPVCASKDQSIYYL